MALSVELQKRYSLFYFIGAVAGSLSGILAFGLSQLDGRYGMGGWRWIFILEGVVRAVDKQKINELGSHIPDFLRSRHPLLHLYRRFPR